MQEALTSPPPLEQADWNLLDRDAAAAAIGVSRTTFYAMIENKILPDGVKIFGRIKMWKVEVIRDIADRLYKGEFSGVKLWEGTKKRKKVTV